MRASKVIALLQTELEVKDQHISDLRADNRALTAALLSAAGQPAAASHARPRAEKPEGETPTDARPIGM